MEDHDRTHPRAAGSIFKIVWGLVFDVKMDDSKFRFGHVSEKKGTNFWSFTPSNRVDVRRFFDQQKLWTASTTTLKKRKKEKKKTKAKIDFRNLDHFRHLGKNIFLSWENVFKSGDPKC